jgi:hypothetical protein
MQLTSDETQAIENGQVVSVAVNATECVILRKDLFERVKYLIYDDADLTQEEMRQILARLGTEAGWDDPQMDVYDNYDEVISTLVKGNRFYDNHENQPADFA